MRKPAFGFFGQVKLNLVCSAKILARGLEFRIYIVLSRQRLIKTMIRLHGFAAGLRLCFSHIQKTGFFHDVTCLVLD